MTKWKQYELIYLGDRVSDREGGCAAAVTARTRCGWVKHRECCELLFDRRFPLKLEGMSMSYVRPEYCMEVKHGA